MDQPAAGPGDFQPPRQDACGKDPGRSVGMGFSVGLYLWVSIEDVLVSAEEKDARMSEDSLYSLPQSFMKFHKALFPPLWESWER